MSLNLKWSKLRLDTDTRALMERAVLDMNTITKEQFHIISHPFGRVIACQAGSVWLFHVGDGGRPPRIGTVAVSTDLDQRSLLPTRRAEDFADCCDLLGFRTEEQRSQFRDFLLPGTGFTSTSKVQGAF